MFLIAKIKLLQINWKLKKKKSEEKFKQFIMKKELKDFKIMDYELMIIKQWNKFWLRYTGCYMFKWYNQLAINRSY